MERPKGGSREPAPARHSFARQPRGAVPALPPSATRSIPNAPFPVTPRSSTQQFSDFLYQLQLQSIETTRAVAPETYTILATDIPAGDSKVGEKFRTLWGSEFAAYTPILEPKVLSKLHAKRRAADCARWRRRRGLAADTLHSMRCAPAGPPRLPRSLLDRRVASPLCC